MHELFPLAAGVLVAMIVQRLTAVRRRVVAFVALSLAFGVVATVISGEWRTSWAYVAVDTAIVGVVAAVAAVAIAWWQRRPLGPR